MATIEDREWWVEILAEEGPTTKRKEECARELAELRQREAVVLMELEQCEEQLRECVHARQRLYATAPTLPEAAALEERIAEQYAIVLRLRHRPGKSDEKLEQAEARLREMMADREPFRKLALTADGGVTSGKT